MKEKLINDIEKAIENGTSITIDFTFGDNRKNGASVTVVPDYYEDGTEDIVICSGHNIFDISLTGELVYDNAMDTYIIKNENYAVEIAA